MEIKAAVCRATHVPVGIESIDIDRPLSREVLVRTVATGVCHSDLHVVDGDGRFALDRGIVLGHEGGAIERQVVVDFHHRVLVQQHALGIAADAGE